MLTEPKVLIIGAGAAGIAAASRLLQKGVENVVILEAKDRIGGRIRTEEFGDNVIELGAQWVHGERGNVVFDLAFRHKLLDSSRNFHDFSKYVFATPAGEIAPREESAEALRIYEDIAERPADELKDLDCSYGTFFVNEFNKIFKENPFTTNERAKQYLEWMHKFDNSIQCSDTWYDVSAKRLINYWKCDGDPVLNWKYHGYKTVFDLLIQKIPDTNRPLPVLEKILFNKEVCCINYTSNNNVIVKTNDGSNYTASHVIVTISLGVLKDKSSTLFVPPLSIKKQSAIKGLNIGTANKIFLEFPNRWWEHDCAGLSLMWSEEDKVEFLKSHGKENEWLCDVFEFFTVDYQPRLLCAWIVGEKSRYMETLSDAEVTEGLCLLLDTFFGRAYNVARPDRIFRSNWHTDEHFQGSYSFQSINSEQLNVFPKDLAVPILTSENKPMVLFAGEATHDHYYSTVHGAVETGFREADRILDFYRMRRRSRKKGSNITAMGRTISSSNEIMKRTKVVIIGAGIAGLAAAKTFEEANFKDYLLIEAQNEIGGRILSIPWNKKWLDCGAQFIHGDQSEIADMCYQNGLLSNIHYRDGGGHFIRDDGMILDTNLVEEIDDLIRTALEECEDCENENIQAGYENIGRALQTWFRKYLRETERPPEIKDMEEEIYDWNVRFLMIDNSCFSLDELSAKYWGKFKFVGGLEHVSFKAGYSSLAKLLLDRVNEKNLRLGAPVEFLEWHHTISEDDFVSPVVLTLSDGSRILADCVIVTCSLGYLKENHREMFIPPLPEALCEGIENLGFGLINKIFLDFGTPWWSKGTKGFQLIWRKHGSKAYSSKILAAWTRDLQGFDVLPDHDGVLLGWVGGHGAHIIENLTEHEVAIDCENVLKHFLQNDNIPPVQKCARTQWNSNKYIRGSYSHISAKCDKNGITPAVLAEPVWGKRVSKNYIQEIPIIMLAGEATHESYYSTTHGAYETGVKQAQNFLQHHITKS